LDTQPDSLILGQPEGAERLEHPALVHRRDLARVELLLAAGFASFSPTTAYRTWTMSTKAPRRPHSQTIASGVESATGAIHDNSRWFVVLYAFERDDVEVGKR
jgi:hypothetical protein